MRKQLDELNKQLAVYKAGGASARITEVPPGTEFAGAATLASPDTPSQSQDITNGIWIADTGATAQMTPNRLWFASYRSYSVPVKLADGNVVYSSGIGTVIIVPCLGELINSLFSFRASCMCLHLGATSSMCSIWFGPWASLF